MRDESNNSVRLCEGRSSRVVASPGFEKSTRLRAFLLYVTEKALQEHPERGYRAANRHARIRASRGLQLRFR
jgi:hypothetical protein